METRLIQSLMNSKAKYILIRAARCSGKTFAMLAYMEEALKNGNVLYVAPNKMMGRAVGSSFAASNKESVFSYNDHSIMMKNGTLLSIITEREYGQGYGSALRGRPRYEAILIDDPTLKYNDTIGLKDNFNHLVIALTSHYEDSLMQKIWQDFDPNSIDAIEYNYIHALGDQRYVADEINQIFAEYDNDDLKAKRFRGDFGPWGTFRNPTNQDMLRFTNTE